MDQTLVHTVFFWLKNPSNKEDSEALLNGLKELKKINLIQKAYIGSPADTNRAVIDNTYHFSITFVFANPKDQEIYQDHEDHHVFIKNCSHLWEKVQVYDALAV